ncbi:MAG: RNA-binding protein [Tannerellaceae bacterium]|jgi:RNA recognition motif-containing protein|nr:RNA-binding protein [Tannerellaceae bacterium]
MNIYVSNLNFSTKSESLQELFAEYGEVSSANIITDRETGRSRGFGFVEMPNEEEGQKAIDELNGTDFEGKTITVNVARPKTERSDGGFNRGGGYNRGGGGYNRGGGGGYNRGGGRDRY